MIVAASASSGLTGAVAGAAGVPVAFVIGIISFFTPCILPLLPGYLSYVSGVSGEELEMGTQRKRVLIGTLLFVLGFSVMFTLLGYGLASITGSLNFLLNKTAERVAGAFVIVMGLAFLTTLAIRTLERWLKEGGARSAVGRVGMRVARFFGTERKLEIRPGAGLAGALPLGAAFAIGWIPCVGPGLATILTIAGTEGSGLHGAVLLFFFSLGFGMWFVIGGLAFRRAARAFAFIRKHTPVLTAVGGLFLLTIGVLLVTNQWGAVIAPLRRWANHFVPPI
jgi:cytochrome c-type biogenesis protein